jgi:hypothetical protein
LKDRLIVVFVFRQKQIKNTFSFVFKRYSQYSQIKSKDFRFLQFSLTEQILDELFCKFHFCLIFTPSVTRNREAKTETTHAEHPRNTPLENTKKFKKSLIGAAGAFFYKKTFTFSHLFVL